MISKNILETETYQNVREGQCTKAAEGLPFYS